MSFEQEPLGVFRRSSVPALAQRELAVAATQQTLHLECELTLFLGFDATGEFLKRHTCLGQYLAVLVDHEVPGYVVLHDVEVTHVQGFQHHVVHVC